MVNLREIAANCRTNCGRMRSMWMKTDEIVRPGGWSWTTWLLHRGRERRDGPADTSLCEAAAQSGREKVHLGWWDAWYCRWALVVMWAHQRNTSEAIRRSFYLSLYNKSHNKNHISQMEGLSWAPATVHTTNVDKPWFWGKGNRSTGTQTWEEHPIPS